MLIHRLLRIARNALPRTGTGWSTAIISLLLAALVTWVAVRIFGAWSLPFLGGFFATYAYSLWQQRRADRAKQHAATLAHIAEMEREMGYPPTGNGGRP